jgi:hypothetical protein
MEMPQKFKMELPTIQQSPSGYLSKRIEVRISKASSHFYSLQLMSVGDMRQPQYPTTDKCKKKT